MNYLRNCWAIIFIALLSIAQSNAVAATDPGSQRMMVFGSWELLVMRDTNGNFMGYWAVPTTQLSVGNIRRMWFEPTVDNDWEVFAHEPVNADAILESLLLDGLSQDSKFLFQWRESSAKENFVDQQVDGGAQGPVSKGFIVGDPLSEAAGAMSDPAPMIDLLADVNYPVAPGMTELMVNGTAGANVSMNQATKQLLDCLRSVNPFGCGVCVCLSGVPVFVPGPWVVSEIPIGTSFNCTYTRSIQVILTYFGQYVDCTDCARTEVTSFEDSAVIPIWNGSDGCPMLDDNGDPIDPPANP